MRVSKPRKVGKPDKTGAAAKVTRERRRHKKAKKDTSEVDPANVPLPADTSLHSVTEDAADVAKTEQPEVTSSSRQKSIPKPPAPETPTAPLKKKPSSHKGTSTRVTRMPLSDRQDYAKTNRAIYIAASKYAADRTAVHAALQTHIVDTAHKGLTGVSSSGGTFYAVLYDSTQHRDSALRRLRATPFRYNDTAIALKMSTYDQEYGASRKIS